jgi:hypothetical protein
MRGIDNPDTQKPFSLSQIARLAGTPNGWPNAVLEGNKKVANQKAHNRLAEVLRAFEVIPAMARQIDMLIEAGESDHHGAQGRASRYATPVNGMEALNVPADAAPVDTTPAESDTPAPDTSDMPATAERKSYGSVTPAAGPLTDVEVDRPVTPAPVETLNAPEPVTVKVEKTSKSSMMRFAEEYDRIMASFMTNVDQLESLVDVAPPVFRDAVQKIRDELLEVVQKVER